MMTRVSRKPFLTGCWDAQSAGFDLIFLSFNLGEQNMTIVTRNGRSYLFLFGFGVFLPVFLSSANDSSLPIIQRIITYYYYLIIYLLLRGSYSLQ